MDRPPELWCFEYWDPTDIVGPLTIINSIGDVWVAVCGQSTCHYIPKAEACTTRKEAALAAKKCYEDRIAAKEEECKRSRHFLHVFCEREGIS